MMSFDNYSSWTFYGCCRNPNLVKTKKSHKQKNEQDIQEIQICLSFLWDSENLSSKAEEIHWRYFR